MCPRRKATVCNCSKKMDNQTRSIHTKEGSSHSSSPSFVNIAGLIEINNQESHHISRHSAARKASKIRTKSTLYNHSTSHSVLSSTNDEIDTITSPPNHVYNSSLASKSSTPLKKCSNSRRNLEKIIPSPILDENLHIEAEYSVKQDKTNEIVTIERVEYDDNENSYIDSESSDTESMVSLNSILIEEKDLGPDSELIYDNDFNDELPVSEEIPYRKKPAFYLRRHSMSDIHRRIHVLDELLFSIDFEYGASDIGPEAEIISDHLPVPGHELAKDKVHGGDGRHLKHSSSNTEVIIDAMFAGNKQHSCCKTRRKLSWNSRIRRKKRAAQLNMVPRRRPRKIVIIGDMCSGKSALISAYCKDKFNEMYVPTILRSCITDADLQGEKIELVVIEISGREDYQKLRHCSYRKTDAIILCYSCTNPSSLDKIKSYWLPEVKKKIPNVPLVLVGTKKDIRDEALDQLEGTNSEDREKNLKTVSANFVSRQVGQDLSESIGAHCFLECSAKYRDGTRDIFETVAKVALQKSRRKRKVQKNSDVCAIM